VWEFLLGVYDEGSTKTERDGQRQARREMYGNLKVQHSTVSKADCSVIRCHGVGPRTVFCALQVTCSATDPVVGSSTQQTLCLCLCLCPYLSLYLYLYAGDMQFG